jgi:hypothetical protein
MEDEKMSYSKTTWVNGITAINKDVMNNIENGIYNLDQAVNKGASIIPSVAYGMNNKISVTGANTVQPKFTIQGKTVVNLLGKDGNCEDVSKWDDVNSTHTLDGSNKVFGSNGIKMTMTASASALRKLKANLLVDATKYYAASAYLKNGNITSGVKMVASGASVSSEIITDTTAFHRVFIKLSPANISAMTDLWIIYGITGTSGQYAYVDGIMIEEITAAQYADSSFQPSPYVDSYACLQNPYMEVRHDNLVRNGNGEEGVAWWNVGNNATSSVLSIVNGKFQFTVTGTPTAGCYFGQIVSVKPNTNYYLASNLTGGIMLQINDGADNVAIVPKSTTSNVTFNTGSYNSIHLIFKFDTASTGTADSIMLIEGTTAPSSYKPCILERVVLETKLTSDDSITYDNGEVTGLINWKHKTLFGKDYDWQYGADLTGYKALAFPSISTNTGNLNIITKYDGKIIPFNDALTVDTQSNRTWESPSRQYISVSDTDTGWAESITPNSDEVKAFMNGWKAVATYSSARYVAWVSIVDGSVPSGSINTTVATAFVSGGTSLIVQDGSKFSVNDYIAIKYDTGGWSTPAISAINGNTLTLNVAMAGNCAIGNIIIKMDNGSTNISLLNYCKNNVAPGYEGYQLHYKLATPEPITDDNCHIHGDVPMFDAGDNYLYLDSGMVLGEVANPYYASSYWIINDKNTTSQLKNKTEDILSVYRNLIKDINWPIYYNDVYAYGKARTYINTNFDTNATYTVDYKILATQAPQVGSLACSYNQDLITAVNKLEESVNSKQEHDSILDTIVDLSLYEANSQLVMWDCFKYDSNNVYVGTFIPFASIKKTIPVITIKGYQIMSGYTDCTSKFTLNNVNVAKNGFYINFKTQDAATIALFANGFYNNNKFSYIVDCRERI